MLVKTWNRDYILSPATAADMTDAILNMLCRRATADNGGTEFIGESLSYVIFTLRDKHHFSLPGPIHACEDVFKALGFETRRARLKNNHRNGYGAACTVVTV